MTVPNLMYVDGKWTPASDGAEIDIINPADEEKVGTVPVATVDDLNRALESAERAWRSWREVDVWTRSKKIRKVSEIIKGRVDEIAAVLTEEQGKSVDRGAGKADRRGEGRDRGSRGTVRCGSR